MGLATAGEGQGDGPGRAWEGVAVLGSSWGPQRSAGPLQGQKGEKSPPLGRLR